MIKGVMFIRYPTAQCLAHTCSLNGNYSAILSYLLNSIRVYRHGTLFNNLLTTTPSKSIVPQNGKSFLLDRPNEIFICSLLYCGKVNIHLTFLT